MERSPACAHELHLHHREALHEPKALDDKLACQPWSVVLFVSPVAFNFCSNQQG